MAKYVDGFVLASEKNLVAYKKMARRRARYGKYGADYQECVMMI
jgi:uncharacterized protein YbaA (DUF1428 family)